MHKAQRDSRNRRPRTKPDGEPDDSRSGAALSAGTHVTSEGDTLQASEAVTMRKEAEMDDPRVEDPPLDGTGSNARALDLRTRLAGTNWATVVLVAAPVVFFAVVAWNQRWMSDDGFINVRVVQQILAGNGPVFNAGERVEAATSPLWVLWLVVGQFFLFWLPVEWVAMVGGIGMSIGALVLAVLGARRAFGTSSLLPVGLLLFVAVPPAASYATSGLENGMTSLWIAGWYVALLRALDARQPRATAVAAIVIGLGPLVRPDLAVMSLLAGLALLAIMRKQPLRSLILSIGAGLVVPVSYQVFRMGYYGALLPNTAYVKEASRSMWDRGFIYLTDFTSPYRMWLPAVIILASLAFVWRSRSLSGRSAQLIPATPTGPGFTSPRARALVFATPVVAGLVHSMLVIRAGGDFMHGRMLLPGLFAMLLPVAALPRTRQAKLLSGAALIWAVTAFLVGGPPYDGIGPDNIDNEPELLATGAGRENPITLQDYDDSSLVLLGTLERDKAENGPPALTIFLISSGIEDIPLDPRLDGFLDGRSVFAIGAIGLPATTAGQDVYVADMLSLANPVGSRFDLPASQRERHDKFVPPAWTAAMFADPAAPMPPPLVQSEVDDARTALACPDVTRLLNRARSPMSPRRFARNFLDSLTTFSFRIDPDPAVAAEC